MKKYLWVLILAGVLILQGCVSLSTFNTPTTTKKDNIRLGIGLGGMGVGEATVGPFPEVYGRVGLGERVDIGGKFTGPLGGITADVKYQLVDQRLKMAADLSGSIFFAGPNSVQPGLLVGTEHLYLGGRLMVFPGPLSGDQRTFEFDDVSASTVMPGVLLGASIGNQEFRVMPEVSAYFAEGTDRAIFVPGLGLRFRLGGNE